MTVLDKARLREALEWHDRLGRAGMLNVDPRIEAVVEAARLVADPDTLIIGRENGEWPIVLLDQVASELNLEPLQVEEVLDALLAQQTGDTK